MYQNIFAIDETPYKDRKANKETTPEHLLNNYNYYLPKLDKEIYLMVFMEKGYFEIDILELEDFLFTQYGNSENPSKFLKTLQLKVIPLIDNIINNCRPSFEGNGGFYNERPLEDGFVETEGTIKNNRYTIDLLYHKTAFLNLKEDLSERKELTKQFITEIDPLGNTDSKKLKWNGKPSHLAFIIKTLIDEGYITPPKGNNNEINSTALTREILESFQIQKGALSTFLAYLNPDSEKHIKLKEAFDNEKFNIPNSKLLG